MEGGTLNLAGGAIAVDAFGVGTEAGRNASFDLLADKSLAASDEYIGYSGTGRLVQTGGTNTIASNLSLGGRSGGAGTYVLKGGTISVGGSVVNGAGTGMLSLDGGRLTVAGGIDVDTLALGGSAGSNVSYVLGAGGWYEGAQKVVSTLNVAKLVLGDSGIGNVEQTGGAQTIAGDLHLGATAGGMGTLTLKGGTFSVAGGIVNGLGTGTLSLDGGSLTVGGGINVDTLALGKSAGSNVSYSWDASGLYEGTRKVAATVNATNWVLGEAGNGNLTQNAALSLDNLTINKGTYKVAAGTLTVNNSLGNNGTLALAGGTVAGAGRIAQGATGMMSGYGRVDNAIDNAGTIMAKSGNLILTGNLANSGLLKNHIGANLFVEGPVSHTGNIEVNAAGTVVFDAAITNGAGKTVQLNGGALATPTLSNVAGGQVRGFGTVAGNVDNAGTVEFYGPTNVVGDFANRAGATLQVRNDQTLITGHTVNDGTITTRQGKVAFEGGLTNNGAYLSDPSDNYFTDLVVNPSGYLVGEAGDRFLISGAFENRSLMNAAWNTGAAQLVLNGSALQSMYLASADRGAAVGGYANNFAWGGFSLVAGSSVTFQDGNSESGAALYVGLVELGGGLGQLASINSPYNIYYDASLAGNAYLGGQAYALNGGGYLMAAQPVPEPEAYALMLAGLGLVGFRVRRRRQFDA